MIRWGIRTKLFALALGLIAATVLVASLLLTPRLSQLLTERLREDLHRRTKLAVVAVDKARLSRDDAAKWQALSLELGREAEARVTLLAADGTVLGDSLVAVQEVAHLENHALRPEIVQARNNGVGESLRSSHTLGAQMLYVAQTFHDDNDQHGVVRLALPLTEVERLVGVANRSLLLAGAMALLFAVVLTAAAAVLASRSAERLTQSAQRMAAGDLACRTGVTQADEFGELGRVLDQLAANLSATLLELRGERDLLAGILDTMQEGVLLLDPYDAVVRLNPGLGGMLQIDGAVVGRSLLEVVRLPALKTLVAQVRQSGSPGRAELELPGPPPQWLRVSAVPTTRRPGEVLCVCVDVSELLRATQVRRDFVANASHELRTPVATLAAAAETLQQSLGHDPEASRQCAEMIGRHATRLGQLVADLLELSRAEATADPLVLDSLPVEATVQKLLEPFKARAGSKGIQLFNETTSVAVPMRVHARAFERVLSNLVDNALKYGPGPGSVTVRAVLLADFVEFSVIDTGPGIASQHLPRLFERFYRVDPGRSRELGGTGLGLAIVRHYVLAMGGQVQVHSQVGQGSTFSFTVPRG